MKKSTTILLVTLLLLTLVSCKSGSNGNALQEESDGQATHAIEVIVMEGSSMLPTIAEGDELSIMLDEGGTLSPGDIIAFFPQSDTFDGAVFVKRIIAVEGQTIDIDFDFGQVFVDGVQLDESYINEPTYNRLSFEGPVTVPAGYVFVMGDNRNHSVDSRDASIGFIDIPHVLGVVV